MTRLRRKRAMEVPTSIFDQKTVSDSPAPFDQVGIKPSELQTWNGYYRDELDDYEQGKMNPPNTNQDPQAESGSTVE